MTSSANLKPQPRALVTVLGSINMDLVVRVRGFPKPGETILASTITRHGGGKGANQAIAASRAGADARMIGAVGQDPDGRYLLSLLERNGVDCTEVRVVADHPTGTAHVTVNDQGENQIIVVAGANASAVAHREKRGGVLLTQLEVPLASAASFLARRCGRSVTILNAGPFIPDATRVFGLADLIILNETELAAYCHTSQLSQDADKLAALGRELLTRKGQRIVITLGARGSVIVGWDGTYFAASPSTFVVDSTGAGDCFCGFLPAELAAARDLAQAVRTAHCAAALAVNRLGASSSIPTMSEVLQHSKG